MTASSGNTARFLAWKPASFAPPSQPVTRGAELGEAQSRLQTLDDDYYVRGVLALRRYRSIRTKLEGEVERLHATVDGASKQRLVLHPDPGKLWAEADFGQRRELLGLIVERVRVLSARRGARFDPARVRIEAPLLSAVPLDRRLNHCLVRPQGAKTLNPL